jgi:dihydropteroate synthase
MSDLFPTFGSRAWVFGVLNVTPDSFSDGGRWDHTDTAVEHGRELARQGADVIDVGGESTRPGAHRIDAATETARVIPVIRTLSADGLVCSVDTTRARVAQAALEAGALIINDVSGGLADPEMAQVAAETGAPWILMHWRGHSADMQERATYSDVVAEVRTELLVQVERALAAGVDERSLILDPGLGFAKDASHNWLLLQRLCELTALGLPVLVGASRKRFLGQLLATADGGLRPPADREAATAAVSVLAAADGAWGVRVHEPGPTRDALAVLSSVRAGRQDAENSTEAVLSTADLPGARFGRLRVQGSTHG